MITERKYIKRLEKLADFLETKVPKESFDMGTVVRTENGWSSKELKTNLKNSTCGTAGCAIGWCPIIFPKHFEFSHSSVVLVGNVRLKQYLLHDFYAVEEFFGIDRAESTLLFAPSSYSKGTFGYNGKEADPTPKQVARQIRHFLKREINKKLVTL